MTIITTNLQLTQLCRAISQEKFITLDTEFLRDKTYYPKLCLIQIGYQNKAVAIDPLAEGIDISLLWQVIHNQNILKVFHAAKQDIEIILKLSGRIPTPIFDTQIAAMVCGFGDSVSYENLINNLLGASIDKTSRYSDWSNRPLSAKQVEYALNDVIHLYHAYIKLSALIEQNNRSTWIEEEIAALINEQNYNNDPEEAWLRVKIKSHKPKFLRLVQQIAKWRELTAQKLDTPRGHLMRDEVILDLASNAPVNVEALKKIRSLNPRIISTALGNELIEVINNIEGKGLPNLKQESNKWAYGGQDNGIVLLLKLLLKHKSEEYDVAERLIATSKEITKIAYESNFKELEDLPAFNGWRYEVFGKQAIELKQGKLGFTSQGEKLRLVKLN